MLKSTHIDINVMAAIVAQTGAMVNSLGSLLYMKEEHQKTLVDIGVLRFPDLDNPYFKVSDSPSFASYGCTTDYRFLGLSYQACGLVTIRACPRCSAGQERYRRR